MRTLAFTAFLLAMAPTLALAATDDELRQQIVGAWGENAACADSLVFNADGSFTMVRAGDDPAGRGVGTWSIAGGVLSGATPDCAMPDVMLRIEATKLYFEEAGQVVNELTRCES